MSIYLASNLGIAIDVATGPDGRAIDLIFSKRRHFTDGMKPDALYCGRLT